MEEAMWEPLRAAILIWLEQFDSDALSVVEQQTAGPAPWSIRIDPNDHSQASVLVAWTWDPVQVVLGQNIGIERVGGEPEDVLPLLDAAANGRVREQIWIREGEVVWSKGEIQLEDKIRKDSRGGLDFWNRNTPPNETIVYMPWRRR